MQQLGDYTILGILGEGGMATVYEAEERLSRRAVALKVMRDGFGASPRVHQLFLGEMAILGRIDHPNVVRLLASLELEGRMVMVLELIRGETLRATLSRLGRLAWPDAVRILQQILAALSAAHSQQPPVVHRDLKPENIMIAADGTVKVTDFGIAKVLRDGTRATTDVGTLQYMCPEQIEGVGIDHRADLYNVGLIMYEALAGAQPFRSSSTRELLNAQCTAPPPALPPETAASVPSSLVELMLQLLAKSPDERPPSAQVVQQRLATIMEAPGPPATILAPQAPPMQGPSSVVRPPMGTKPRTRGTSPAAVVASIAAFGLLAGLAGWLVLSRSDDGVVEEAAASSSAVAPPTELPQPTRPPATSVPPVVPRPSLASTAAADPPAAIVEDRSPVAAPLEEPSAAGQSRVGAAACLVEGRASGADDIVILVKDSPEPMMEWLDGATGETYRTVELEQNLVYCVTPQVLGTVREEETRLDLLDARTGDVLSTTSVDAGVQQLLRDGPRVVISPYTGRRLPLPIPGCKGAACKSSDLLVPFGKLTSEQISIGQSLCRGDSEDLALGSGRYNADQSDDTLHVTAKNDTGVVWSKRFSIPESDLMQCGHTLGEQTSALLLRHGGGKLELRQLALEDGALVSTFTVAEPALIVTAVRAFFYNGKFFLVHFDNARLLALDPTSGDVAWRR